MSAWQCMGGEREDEEGCVQQEGHFPAARIDEASRFPVVRCALLLDSAWLLINAMFLLLRRPIGRWSLYDVIVSSMKSSSASPKKRVTTLGASKSDLASMVWRIIEAQPDSPITYTSRQRPCEVRTTPSLTCTALLRNAHP